MKQLHVSFIIYYRINLHSILKQNISLFVSSIKANSALTFEPGQNLGIFKLYFNKYDSPLEMGQDPTVKCVHAFKCLAGVLNGTLIPNKAKVENLGVNVFDDLVAVNSISVFIVDPSLIWHCELTPSIITVDGRFD